MKRFILACFAVTALLFQPAFAVDAICNDDDISLEQKQTAGCDTASSPEGEVIDTLRNIMNPIYFGATIAAVGAIIFGGFRFSLSQGDPSKVKKAKDTIMYAIIGLIVVLSAFAITNFILGIV